MHMYIFIFIHVYILYVYVFIYATSDDHYQIDRSGMGFALHFSIIAYQKLPLFYVLLCFIGNYQVYPKPSPGMHSHWIARKSSALK